MSIERLEHRRLLASGSQFADGGDAPSDGYASEAYEWVLSPIQVPHDVDEPVGRAPSDIELTNATVPENRPEGTKVGEFMSTDPDEGDVFSYALVTGDGDSGNGLFHIEGNVLRTSQTFDFEAGNRYSIRVRSTDSTNRFTEKAFAISVADANEFRIGEIADVNLAAEIVREGSAGPAEVGITARAEDSDGTDTVTYSLVDDADGRFTINPETGVVELSAVLDAEAATQHTIQIQATSSDGTWTTAEFTISVSDVNEYGIGDVVDADDSSELVPEDAAIGTPVNITAQAVDPDVSDTVQYRLTENEGERFAIDPQTGVITLAAPLDAETAASHTVEVQASSTDGSWSLARFTILVVDTDEYELGPVTDVDESWNIVAEDVAVGTAVGITALADDADIADTVTYTLTDDADGRFTIAPETGIVRVASPLDAETSTNHTIEVRATSRDGSWNAAHFAVLVSDVDEFDVEYVIDVDESENAVAEDAAIGSAVGITVQATDDDLLGTVSYQLVDDAYGLFAIDASSGTVTVARPLDAETASEYPLRIRATSTDGSSSLEAFTVQVLDIDETDVTPVVDTDDSPNTVAAAAVVGAAVGITVKAEDSDITDQVYYEMIDDADGCFAVDAMTGVVSVAGSLDTSGTTEHTVSIQAISTDGTTSRSEFQIVVSPDPVAERPWQNPIDPSDVNRDGQLTPSDVLLLINEINSKGARKLPPPADGEQPGLYLDTDGDGFFGPSDVLHTINKINEAARRKAAMQAQGPGPSDTPPAAAPADAVDPAPDVSLKQDAFDSRYETPYDAQPDEVDEFFSRELEAERRTAEESLLEDKYYEDWVN